MTEIRFYHLQKQTLDQALPAILKKALAGGHKMIVKFPDTESAERMNQHLWTYDPNGFIPHGSKKDGYDSHQPIWLTDQDDNPNGAKTVFTVNNATCEKLENYDLYCHMFDGFNQDMVQNARERWKLYKDRDFTLTYWKQDETGKWSQAA